ncbi:MAG TPA: carboxypeptidase regulatory-like domain-containing protein [Thermoanaerobaculia bacterium]|jgi:protocatechuate 3,4-dioxygenase beta subunit|nr:carboxypeptidase regulatory-like domain-containing protein [Thermoanaerobaculia bacterium]
MRRRLIVLAFCLSAVLPATAAVTGYVMTTDGQPIARAKVETFSLEPLDAARARLLSDAPERKPLATAETDAKGKFTLESPKDPVVLLRVTAKGYAPDTYRIERDEEVGAVAMAPAEPKSGRITANGKAVAGAKVIWISGGTTEIIATTDGEGRYSVPDPSKWAMAVVVIHPDFAFHEDSVGRRMGSANLPLDQTLTAGVALSGTVIGEDGKTPVAAAIVKIEGWPVATSAQDGTFTIAHAQAKWQAVVAQSGALIGSRARAGNPATVAVKLARSASLTGSIRDLKSQAPLAGAEVRLRASNRIDLSETWTAFTDAKGNYAINGVAPGAYQIVVTRPGYMVAPVSLSLTANEKANKPLLATQLARVSGMVVDEQKRPVVAARVSSQNVSRGGDPMMMMAMMMIGRASSGSVSAPDGSFTVRADGDTDIHIAAVKKGYPPTKTTTLRLAPGERKSGIMLTIPSGVAITGRVIDKDGKPVAGVSIATTEATEFSGNMVRRMMALGAQRDRGDDIVKTANDGKFSLRLKEGSYDFAFKHEGFATKTVRALQVNSTTKPIEVTLEPGVEISGRVTRNGAGIEGVRMMVIGEGVQASAETAADGSFRISDLTPGQMMLNAMKEDEFIQQIRPVTAPALDMNIEIPPGGRVSGHVVDKSTKQPVTSFQAGISTPRSGGGMVIMMPPQMRSFTNDDGTFALENVPAGQTQIVVNAPGYTTARVPNVNVEEGKNISDIEVEMDHGVRVVGHVTGPDGGALAGVVVRLDMMGGRVMRPGPMQNQSAITDANGDYSIDALESGDKTFVFTRSGYVATQKSATLSGNETRVDAQLGSGMRVSGVVVTDAGAPVSDAAVNANSAGNSGFGTPNTVTDANGGFTFEGLAPGHYNFYASKRGLSSGEVRDFDISTAVPVHITLKSGGVIYGRVSGLTSDELQQAAVVASSASGYSSAPVDASGSFRIEGAPTGTVRVSARLQGGMAGGKSSPVQSVQLDTGNQVEVNIAFNADTVIRGRVTRNGKPVDGTMVAFTPKEAQAQTSARTTTNSNGEYSVNGLDDATYNVSVVDIQRSAPFNTTYQVRGSGSFDVDMKSASLTGRVNDSEGNAVADAMIELREKTDSSGRFAMRGVQTDASGAFLIDNVQAGSYSVTAEKDGYGTKAVDTTVGDGGGNVEITLSKNAGVTLRVVDARDGRLLGARVLVTDSRNVTVYSSPPMGSSAEAVKLPLESGVYRALISAPGYAPQNVTITSPSTPTVGMTPGGSIVVQSKGSGLRRARLIGPDGKEYVRGFGAIFTVDPSPGVTVLNNIAPGMYTLQILGDGNQVTASAPVSVIDGQQASVSI